MSSPPPRVRCRQANVDITSDFDLFSGLLEAETTQDAAKGGKLKGGRLLSADFRQSQQRPLPRVANWWQYLKKYFHLMTEKRHCCDRA